MNLLKERPEQQMIVIVEGDIGNATALEMLLSMGTEYISLIYHSALELLESLDEIERSQLALFFVDYFLPDINGVLST